MVEINGGGEYSVCDFPADRHPIDIGDYYADFSKIRTELGWVPKKSLSETIESTLNYYRGSLVLRLNDLVRRALYLSKPDSSCRGVRGLTARPAMRATERQSSQGSSDDSDRAMEELPLPRARKGVVVLLFAHRAAQNVSPHAGSSPQDVYG